MKCAFPSYASVLGGKKKKKLQGMCIAGKPQCKIKVNHDVCAPPDLVKSVEQK